ncbi:DUF5134 domain-containing protein [Streptomyces canus]|uniref:DUF5134 domain-containing protein n=2 Tax=Streptomyces canus TaxID=58343 RepID=UPI002B1DF821|nr:DUF5134 domain-containing protein [Streptomyces canus]
MFAVPVGYGVWRLVLPATGIGERVDHALHAAMGVLMIAMARPWGMDLPVVPQVVPFSAGTVWFVAAAPVRAEGRSRGRTVLATLPHVVMTGAMAWMVSAMESSGMLSATSEAAATQDMAGMDMSSGTGLASMSLTGTGARSWWLIPTVMQRGRVGVWRGGCGWHGRGGGRSTRRRHG